MKIGSGIQHFAILQKKKLVNLFAKNGAHFQLPIRLDDHFRILLCLPVDSRQPHQILNAARNIFPHQFLLICSPVELPLEGETSCVLYHSFQMSLWRTEARLRAAIGDQEPFHVAIDLNSEFSLLPALICQASRASLRIAREKKNVSLFFNVILGKNTITDKENDPFVLLEQLAKLMK